MEPSVFRIKNTAAHSFHVNRRQAIDIMDILLRGPRRLLLLAPFSLILALVRPVPLFPRRFLGGNFLRRLRGRFGLRRLRRFFSGVAFRRFRGD
jgi:hypothetical protein